MAISERALSSNGVGGTTAGSLTINAPTGTAQGDVLFAAIVGTDANDFTAPSGWTMLTAINNGDTSAPVGEAIFYKVAGASEPGSYTFTSVAAAIAGGIIVGYIGASTVTPLDVWASTSTTIYGGNPASSVLTASFAGDLALVFIAAATTGSLPTAMTGWTHVYGNAHNVGAYQIDRFGFSLSSVSAGIVASASTTTTVTAGWASVTVALVASGNIAASVIVAGHSQSIATGQLQGAAHLAGHSAATTQGQFQAAAHLTGHSDGTVLGQLQGIATLAGHSVATVSAVQTTARVIGPTGATANDQASIVTTVNDQSDISETSRT